MARRGPTRVSDAQWNLLLGYLELHPSMLRARGYNNSAQGRAESSRLWEEVALLLNGEGSTKTAKEWSIYVSNYKSRLKRTIADINADAIGTGGGPPQSSTLTDIDQRFLAMLGPGFGLAAPRVSVDPFPIQVQQSPQPENIQIEDVLLFHIESPLPSPNILLGTADEAPGRGGQNTSEAVAPVPPLPRRTRQRRARSRPLAPLDEARRILAQVEIQRAAADAAHAQALQVIGQNLGRLAEATAEKLGRLAEATAEKLGRLSDNLGRLANAADRYLSHR